MLFHVVLQIISNKKKLNKENEEMKTFESIVEIFKMKYEMN